MLRYFLVLMVVLLAAPAWSFGNTDANALRVGIATNYPPVAFREKGKISGIEADLAQLLARQLKRQLKLVEIPWDDLEKNLNSGNVDVVMSGVSVTPERQQRMLFAEPYMSIGQMLLINADNIVSLAPKQALYAKGRRVGVEKNTTAEQFARRELVDARITAFDSVEDAIAAIKSNRIDYFMHDAPTIWHYTLVPKTQDRALFGLYQPLTSEPIAWVVKSGNQALLQELNNALGDMRRQGLVDAVINKWIPFTVEVGSKQPAGR